VQGEAEMSKCPANPSGGGHAIRMGPEEVAEYIRKEMCKGRRKAIRGCIGRD